MNLQPFPGNSRSTYPGEYTPDPFLFEGLRGQNFPNLFDAQKNTFSQANITEDAEYYRIELDTPGLTRRDFLVRINERGNLVVAGLQKSAPAFSEKVTPGMNSVSGFSRELVLPDDIDTDFIKAEYKFGVLTIWFLKTGKPYPKRPSLVVVY